MRDSCNILFFSIEDLNDWIEPLGGHPDAITPNLARLADRGMVFEQAYAPAPACSPSRTATLFGKAPWTTGVYDNKHRWHHAFATGKRQSLIGRFRDGGWVTKGAGKVFHQNRPKFDRSDWNDWHEIGMERYDPISRLAQSIGKYTNTDFGPSPDEHLQYDDLNTDWMIGQIRPGQVGQFWALGLYRPHLPFIAPRRFFDLLPEEVADPPGLGLNRFDPTVRRLLRRLPQAARIFAKRTMGLGEQLSETGEYRAFLRAYLASIAYADYNLGRVLDRLEETGQDGRTLICLWSDHGWQLGEKLAFRKFSLWERALRVPLIFAGPGVRPGRSDEPVSLLDIAPTLLARAGLDVPASFDGQDLAPLLKGQVGEMRGFATSVWGKGFGGEEPVMAQSVRSRQYRYTFYWDGSEELYDHEADPFEHENMIADSKGHDEAEINRLREWHLSRLNQDFADPAI